jgi:hypothetical protein
VVEEVGAAGVAVEIPGDDGVLGGGVHAALPAPEHARPLKTLHEQQPHPTATATRSIDGSITRSGPKSSSTLTNLESRGRRRRKARRGKERRRSQETKNLSFPFLEEMANEGRGCYDGWVDRLGREVRP